MSGVSGGVGLQGLRGRVRGPQGFMQGSCNYLCCSRLGRKGGMGRANGCRTVLWQQA